MAPRSIETALLTSNPRFIDWGGITISYVAFVCPLEMLPQTNMKNNLHVCSANSLLKALDSVYLLLYLLFKAGEMWDPLETMNPVGKIDEVIDVVQGRVLGYSVHLSPDLLSF